MNKEELKRKIRDKVFGIMMDDGKKYIHVGRVLHLIDQLDEVEVTDKMVEKYGMSKTKWKEVLGRYKWHLEEVGYVVSQKPVIPQFVAEWYENNKEGLTDAFVYRYTKYPKTPTDKRDSVDNWFANTDNVMEILIKMKDGYTVEEKRKK